MDGKTWDVSGNGEDRSTTTHQMADIGGNSAPGRMQTITTSGEVKYLGDEAGLGIRYLSRGKGKQENGHAEQADEEQGQPTNQQEESSHVDSAPTGEMQKNYGDGLESRCTEDSQLI